MIPSSSSCFYAYDIIFVVVNIVHVCVRVCVCLCVCGWEGGGRKSFQVVAGLCQRLLAYGFPSECSCPGFV